MIELKKLNVHRIVDSEEAAVRLEADGFTVVKPKGDTGNTSEADAKKAKPPAK